MVSSLSWQNKSYSKSDHIWDIFNTRHCIFLYIWHTVYTHRFLCVLMSTVNYIIYLYYIYVLYLSINTVSIMLLKYHFFPLHLHLIPSTSKERILCSHLVHLFSARSCLHFRFQMVLIASFIASLPKLVWGLSSKWYFSSTICSLLWSGATSQF